MKSEDINTCSECNRRYWDPMMSAQDHVQVYVPYIAVLKWAAQH